MRQLVSRLLVLNLPLNPDHPREDFVRERQVLLPEVQLEDVPEHGRLLPEVGGGVSVGAEEEEEEVFLSQLLPQPAPVEMVPGWAGGDDDMLLVARSGRTEIGNLTTITSSLNTAEKLFQWKLLCLPQ